MKAGTTSLYHYLRDHPQVYMPAFKAPEFFAAGTYRRRGEDWYRGLFAGAPPDVKALGEASNVYTKFPRYQGVPQRIAAVIPDVRLLYVVRDPIERIRSHFVTRLVEGTEKSPFDTAVFENPIYLDYSRYAMQIDQYLGYFPREQLLVLTSENLRRTRGLEVRRAYAFIGVDPQFVPDDLDRDFYQTKDKPVRSPVPVWVRKSLKKYVPATKRGKELESNVVRAVNRVLHRAGERPAAPTATVTLSDGTRERLVERLRDDVRRLKDLLGPEFDGWGIA